MRILPLLCTIAAFPTSTVLAGETEWHSIAPDVSIRLISAGTVSAEGKALMALEIDMPEGTKTYWRVPGEAGLPIDLDLSASSGITGHRMLWPYPLRELKDGALDYVYYGHTVLPVEIEVSDTNGRIEMLATLGICSDICVPAQARFALPVSDGAPDNPNGLRIRQAMAEVPIAWDEVDDAVGKVELLSDSDTIGIWLDDSSVAPASVIAATVNGDPLFGAPQKSPHTDLVVLPILGKSDNSALEGMDVELTFMTDMGAYVVSRTIESGNAELEAALGDKTSR